VTLDEVRRWARERGIPAARLRQVHDGALLHVVSRLFQAMYRESRAARLSKDARGRWRLEIGREPLLRAPASGPLPFRGLEITGMPYLVRRGKRRPLRSAAALLAALRRCLAGAEYARMFDALRSDFQNSVANVVLNRLLGGSLPANACAIEPAYQGHQYYPFPALRIGPSLSQVLECSHLCRKPVELPLLDIGPLRMASGAYDTHEALFRAWSGLSGEPLFPVHPWHLRLSPVLRELSDCVSACTVKAIPLASQRTCRIVRTGFDLKLALDATLTGEHRLLYPLNCLNAPVVSALARHVLATSGVRRLDFQLDVASIFHARPGLAPHLSAIVRLPVPARRGEIIIPAINLWTGRCEARALLRGADAARIEEFFARYCGALMSGPVELCTEWGMAFEPHLQNVYVAFRDGMPAGIVLRDLDNSILDPRRTRPLFRDLGAEPQADTWRHMPRFDIGARRLVQAMLFGHLGEVMACLAHEHGAVMTRLAGIVEDTWSELEARAPSPSARNAVRKLRGWSDAVKATLRTRLRRANAVEFIRE
jgi:siderophore synthetase component